MKSRIEDKNSLVPKGWYIDVLKNTLKIPITDGPHISPVFYESGIPFVSAEAIKKGNIDFEKIRGYISENDYILFSQKYKPEMNDIYIVKSGASTGNSAIVKTNRIFTIWSPLAAIRANEAKIIPYFLFCLVNSYFFRRQIESNWSYGTQQNIGMGVLSNLNICIPKDTKEQQKIASIFTLLDNIIEQTEQIIRKQQNIKSGLLHDLLTYGIDEQGNIRSPQTHKFVEKQGYFISEKWEVDSIENLFYLYSGATPSTTVEEYWNGEIVWITPNDLNKIKHIYINNSERKITSEGLNSCSATIIPKNAIVMSSRAPIGYLAISTIPFATNQGCKSFCVKNEMRDIPEFFYFSLQFIMDKIKSLGTGTTFQEVSKTDLNSVMLAYPSSKEEQKKISALILKQDKIIKEEDLKLEKLKNIKKGLMEDLLTGKKRVKF